MEAVAALGVAAAAVQFLDFSLQALSLARQIRDNVKGATQYNSGLETAAKYVKEASQELQKENLKTTSAGRRISGIVVKCLNTADELVQVLETVRRTGVSSLTSDVKATFKAMKRRSTIEKLEHTLNSQQSALDSALIYDIRNRISLAAMSQDRDFAGLGVSMQKLVTRLQALEFTDTARSSQITEYHEQIQGQLEGVNTAVVDNASSTVKMLADLKATLDTSLRELQRSGVEAELLSSLWYPELTLRDEAVTLPWQNTCEWVFDDQAAGQLSWSPFPTWLQSEKAVYWVNGKAGSGKSTLMAHLSHDIRTQKHLQIWSQHTKLHVLKFFFWRASSTEFPRTIAGLLRSILYQILVKVEEAAQQIFSAYELTRPKGARMVWTQKSLRKFIFDALRSSTPRNRFCIFIDGLDEYTGDDTSGRSYDDLLELLEEIKSMPGIKICVSSRRETAFVRKLAHHDGLQMEKLNWQDIYHFASDKLAAASLLHASDFAEQIAFKAEGVFLWAVLVTKSLVQGALNDDDESILQKRLEETPLQISKLLLQIFASIEPVYKESLSFYIMAMKCFPEPPNLALLTAARLGNDIKSYANFARECARTRTQITAQSQGLLEIHEPQYQPAIAWVPIGFATTPAESWRAATMTRRFIYMDASTAAMCDAELSTMHWLHRSAYDLFLDGAPGGELLSNSKWTDKTTTISLLDSIAHSFLYMPNVSPKLRVRLKLFFALSRTEDCEIENHFFRSLEEVRDLFPFFQARELYTYTRVESGIDSPVDSLCGSTRDFLIECLHETLEVMRRPWLDFVKTTLLHMDLCQDRGWISASLFRRTTDWARDQLQSLKGQSSHAGKFPLTQTPQHQWPILDDIPLIARGNFPLKETPQHHFWSILDGILSTLERYWKDIQQTEHESHVCATIKNPTSISWNNRTNDEGCLLEKGVVEIWSASFMIWYTCSLHPPLSLDRPEWCPTLFESCVLQRTILQRLQDLLDPWNIHQSLYTRHEHDTEWLRMRVQTKHHFHPGSWAEDARYDLSERPVADDSQSPQEQAEQLVESIGNKDDLSLLVKSIRDGIDRLAPNGRIQFRLVCRPHRAPTSETSEFRASVIYDLDINLQSIVSIEEEPAGKIALQSAIIADVWADTRQQLNAWQQLLVLACVKHPRRRPRLGSSTAAKF